MLKDSAPKALIMFTLGVAVLCLPLRTANADGVYVFGGGGFNLLSTPDLDIKSGNGNNREFETDRGFTIAGGFGYRLDDFLIEYEGAFSYNSLDRETLSNGQFNALSDSSVRSVRSLFNLIYEPSIDLPFRPFLGGGIGVSAVSLSDDVGSDTGFAFAYQAKAGLAFELADGLDLIGQYRFVGAAGLELETTLGNADFDNMNHSFEIGLRYAFGGPKKPQTASAPAEPPAPMPASVNNGFTLRDSGSGVGNNAGLASSTQTNGQQTTWIGAQTAASQTRATEPMPIISAPATQLAAQEPLLASAPVRTKTSDGFGVQMGAYKSAESAMKAWPSIAERKAKYVSGSVPVVRPVAVPGKGTLHRLYAGGMDQARAEASCARLKADGQWCQVASLQ